MTTQLLSAALLAVCFSPEGECRPCTEAKSWIFRPSAYSHDWATGERVVQYQPEATTYYRDDPTYMESGYRQSRFALRGADGSYDYMHILQTWGLGEQIRPYGEWEFPYRAGATPYGPWGNPSGPWTLPFDSWINPYGLGKLPNPPWFPFGGGGPYMGIPSAGYPSYGNGPSPTPFYGSSPYGYSPYGGMMPGAGPHGFMGPSPGMPPMMSPGGSGHQQQSPPYPSPYGSP
jgi:hypothetical protein